MRTSAEADTVVVAVASLLDAVGSAVAEPTTAVLLSVPVKLALTRPSMRTVCRAVGAMSANAHVTSRPAIVHWADGVTRVGVTSGGTASVSVTVRAVDGPRLETSTSYVI